MFEAVAAITELFRSRDNFLVAGHENPDGDAYGSGAALCWILRSLGKRVVQYVSPSIPDAFNCLKPACEIVHTPAELDGFPIDWAIVVDCGDPFRIGRDLLERLDRDRIVNIDHHIGNPDFGGLNWVDPRKAAVGEMVAVLARELGVPLAGPLGEAVYMAIASDTGNFTFGNTSPETHEVAAEIIRLGLDPGVFNNVFQNRWSINRMRLFSVALGAIKLYRDGEIGVVAVTPEMFAETGTDRFDTDGLVEFVRRIQSVRVACALRLDAEGAVKFSLRSVGEDDVQEIAKRFGGGGHRNASGGRIPADLCKSEGILVEAVSEMLDRRGPALQGACHVR